MYLLKQVKVEKDAVLVGKPKPEDLDQPQAAGLSKSFGYYAPGPQR